MGRTGAAPWARFVDRLHDERVKAGLTQEDVAVWMGTTQSAVSEWETHRAHPGVGFIDRWASLFGLHLDFMED